MATNKSPYVRGTPEHYQHLQTLSMKSGITRNIDVEVVLDPKKVTTIPNRSRSTDLGFDLTACCDMPIPSGQMRRIRTGVRVDCPPGYGYLVLGRSGMNARGLINVTSVIDAGYQGELEVILLNVNAISASVEIGDRIAQLVFVPQIHPTFKQVDTFSQQSERGDLGWGSSGK